MSSTHRCQSDQAAGSLVCSASAVGLIDVSMSIKGGDPLSFVILGDEPKGSLVALLGGERRWRFG